MKRFFSTLLIIILICSCNEDVAYVTNTPKRSSSNVVPYKTQRNGYSNEDCVKGCYLCSDYYYKLVFKTKNHGMFLTKKAYSVEMKNQLMYLYIRKFVDQCEFSSLLYHNLKEDYYKFLFIYYRYMGTRAGVMVLNPLRVEKLTKKECDKWIETHDGSYKELEYLDQTI